MLTFDYLTISFSVLVLAILIDIALGEPPLKTHPTFWIGKAIRITERLLRRGTPVVERIQGFLTALSILGFFVISTHLILQTSTSLGFIIPYLLISVFLLKSSIAINSMEAFTKPVAVAARYGEYDKAKALLRHVVRRNTEDLTEQQVLSAAVETVAEGTVDGAISSLFYYTLFGVPGAVAFRVINTLDSMWGYKDPRHINIGWFSAKLDSAANYMPARITGLLTIISAKILGRDWRNALTITKRDAGKTDSLNAGWPMAATAGALRVELEKPGHYRLGEPDRPLNPEDIYNALKIMKMNIVLFIITFTFPTIIILNFLGWHYV